MPLKLIRPGKRSKRSPYWYIRGTIRGIAVDESTGTRDRRAAEEIRIKREAELLQRSIHGPSETVSFLEAAVSYLEKGDGENRFLTPIIEHFGTRRVADLNTPDIHACARTLYPGRAPATWNRQVVAPAVAVLHHAAKEWNMPRRKFERFKEPDPRTDWLRPDEAERLIAACADHLRPLVVFLLYTGARLSEALELDWREVNLQNRSASFLKTKNGHPRSVGLHPRVVAQLANLPEREGRVFRRPDRQPYADLHRESGGQIKTAWSGACRRAKLRRVSPHICRHTWATMFYANTPDLRKLMEAGGWRTIDMVTRYTHVNPKHLRAAFDALPSGDNPGTPERDHA